MAQAIRERTLENINRVKNLIKIYERMKDDKDEYNTDILRAAVVLLHAALEDCLRSLSYSKLPFASSSELHKTELKVQLGKIAEYRNKTVDDLIKDVAFEYLERVTYNNSGDITKALKSLAITLKNFDLVKLDTAIKRRHGIVHRADRIDKEEEVGKVASIQTTHVLKWVEDVERFVELLFETQESQDNDKGVRPLNPK
ncbi:MAG: HEPN domain-containing protein [Gallionella sp.]|nr:HEPN domain-containing protein [Gallionella sp.]